MIETMARSELLVVEALTSYDLLQQCGFSIELLDHSLDDSRCNGDVHLHRDAKIWMILDAMLVSHLHQMSDECICL